MNGVTNAILLQNFKLNLKNSIKYGFKIKFKDDILPPPNNTTGTPCQSETNYELGQMLTR